jgi:hypothetical protein
MSDFDAYDDEDDCTEYRVLFLFEIKPCVNPLMDTEFQQTSMGEITKFLFTSEQVIGLDNHLTKQIIR